jgi:hypothetical protein
MFQHTQRLIEKEYSGENARTLTAAIHGYDRWSSFAQYHRSGAYCAARMREYGLEDVELMEVPADGVTKFGDWAMPLAWDVSEATLEVVEPTGAARLLGNYREEPACLAMWAAPTPPEGQTAEVLFLEDGAKEDDYARVDVRGKVVFTHQSHAGVRGLAARHGAVGIITDHPAREQDELADGVSWMNAWVDHHGWGFLKSDTPMWGFSLTREKGRYLERLLASGGRVLVRAVVHSCLYEGSFTVPTGVIRGESAEEVLVYAHSYEYGAEDNASGCATVLEAARVLGKLIAQGALPRPRRSIRFMMSWECYGSIPWAVQRIYPKRNVVGGLCLDAFGGKKQLTGGRIRIILNPHCQASCTDALAAEIARACFDPQAGYPYELCPWSGGTDHTIFEDPSFDVPMPWLTEHPARFHHTSLDEMDKIDVESLRLEGVFSATYLYALAHAAEAEAAWLARGTRALWEEKLKGAAREALAGLAAKGTREELSAAWQDAHERLVYLAERGQAAIGSVARLAPGEAAERAIEEERVVLRQAASAELEGLQRTAKRQAQPQGWTLEGPEKRRPAKEGWELIPRRLVPGLLTLCSIPPEERAEFNRVTHGESPMWSGVLTFALFWADGRRTLGEIQRLVELELGQTEIDLVAYFRFLQRLGYIAWA